MRASCNFSGLGLWAIMDEQKMTIHIQKEIITLINSRMDNYKAILDRKEGQIKMIKKKQFWKGFKWGLGTGSVSMLLLFIILL